jgi:hypothetical protein
MTTMVEAVARPTYTVSGRVLAPALALGNTNAQATTPYSLVRQTQVRVPPRRDGARINLTEDEV